MQDVFLPKTSFFQSKPAYLASYLLYPKTLKTLNESAGSYWDIPENIQRGGTLKSIKVEFRGVFKKKSCGNSMDFGF